MPDSSRNLGGLALTMQNILAREVTASPLRKEWVGGNQRVSQRCEEQAGERKILSAEDSILRGGGGGGRANGLGADGSERAHPVE